MFKLRLISTIILVPLVIAGILFLPNSYVEVLSGVVFAIAIWEWLTMATAIHGFNIRLILLATFVLIAYNLIVAGLEPPWIYYMSMIWWLAALSAICYYPKNTKYWNQILYQPFVGLLIFLPAWLAFNALHAQTPDGPQLVLLGCALIWGADIGAYCCGKLWGKAKLAPHVSPGKTWAGFYGALAAGCIIMATYYIIFQPPLSLWYSMWLAVLTVLFAVVGDLFESMLKRVYGFKDSGKIIPGHGGMFDRIDSMLAAFPIYYIGLYILQNNRIMCF